MKDKILILHVPVIHRGYVDLFRRISAEVDSVRILDGDLLKEVRFGEDNISALAPEEAKQLVQALGFFKSVEVLNSPELAAVLDRTLVLINDESSRRSAETFWKSARAEREPGLLRCGRWAVNKAAAADFKNKSYDPADRELLNAAYVEAQKSGDWWRQVGAALVRDGLVIARAYNRDMPDDQSSYRLGNIRDYIKTGEKPEFSNAIHAEARIIAEAARDGVSLRGANLYVTHFPCPACAKSIAVSGIAKCFFGEGSANFDAAMVLEAAGVKIIHVPR